MSFDADIVTKNYTKALLTQCDSIEEQLRDSGVDVNFLRLISIQATYDSFKQLVSGLNDLDSQEKIFKVIAYDAKNLVFPVEPNVDYTGNS